MLYNFCIQLLSVLSFRYEKAYKHTPAKYQFDTAILLYTGILPPPPLHYGHKGIVKFYHEGASTQENLIR